MTAEETSNVPATSPFDVVATEQAPDASADYCSYLSDWSPGSDSTSPPASQADPEESDCELDYAGHSTPSLLSGPSSTAEHLGGMIPLTPPPSSQEDLPTDKAGIKNADMHNADDARYETDWQERPDWLIRLRQEMVKINEESVSSLLNMHFGPATSGDDNAGLGTAAEEESIKRRIQSTLASLRPYGTMAAFLNYGINPINLFYPRPSAHTNPLSEEDTGTNDGAGEAVSDSETCSDLGYLGSDSENSTVDDD
jgi:hypothetical protein